MTVKRRTLLQTTAAIATVAAFAPRFATIARAATGLTYTEMDWGRVNDNIPMLDEDPFQDSASRAKYWLPEPPASGSPMSGFWDCLRGKSADGTDNQYLSVLANKPPDAPRPGSELPDLVIASSLPDVASSPPAELPVTATRWSRSENWSGAYISSTDGNMFTQIVGQWNAPGTVKFKGPADGHCRGSIWIGLDGQARYPNATLPQIGTAQIFTEQGSVLTHQAWFEWWDSRPSRFRGKNKYHAPWYIANLPIDKGHAILCSLEVVQGDKDHPVMARMCIKNQSTGRFIMPFLVYAPIVGRRQDQVTVTGATAEWIVERPTTFDTGKLFTLPDYGSVTFSSCVAVAAPAVGATGTQQGLAPVKYITMFETQQQPTARTINISKPAPVFQDQFTVSYVGP